FKQWNKGIQLAQGKYIWIAESDDYCEPTFVETLVPVLDTNSSVGISYCRSKFIDEQGNFLRDDIIRNFSFAGDYWSRDFVVEGMEIIKKYLYHNNIIPNASAVIFRKSLFFLVKGIPSSMKQCGDWWLWIKILSMSDLAYSVKCLNVFRCHMQTTRVIDTIEKLFQRTKEELM
ncbi:MAG: glycosyltransferase, partial [Bacteroidia bacterium]|nr:glycosyltransferase [Bacteroidia bacterium]